MKKYHINPDTGRPNVCNAQYMCKFNKKDNEHYETKDEANKAYEKTKHQEMMLKDHMNKVKIDEKNVMNHINKLSASLSEKIGLDRSFNIYDWKIKEINENLNNKNFTEYGLIEGAKKLDYIVKVINNSEFSLEKLEELQKIRDDMLKKNYSYTPKNNELLANIADNAIKQWSYSNNQVDYSEIPQRDPVNGLIGLDEAIYYNFKNEEAYYLQDKSDADEPISQEILNDVINYGVAHEDTYINIPGYRDAYENKYILDSRDYLRREINENNNDYMRTVFPYKELKNRLEELNIENVSVSSLNNGREVGLVYTVITPTGETRSFAVYEHRNYENIVINGKTNLKPDELPYVADNSHVFLAEFDVEERKQTADTLAYFLKESQKGTLENDHYLAENAPKIDWTTRLSQQIPGFKEFAEKRGLKINDKKKTDEEVLNDLDFDLNFDND